MFGSKESLVHRELENILKDFEHVKLSLNEFERGEMRNLPQTKVLVDKMMENQRRLI